jgi:MFS family permease
MYFLIRELCELILVIPTTISMKRVGIKRTFVIGCFLTLLNLILLYALPTNRNLFFAAAVSEGLAISLFFLPYHFLFSSAITKKDSGKQLGLMDVIISLVTAFGPLVGGIVAAASSLRTVLLMSVFFVALSVIPLLSGSKQNYLRKFSYTKPFKLLFSRDSVSNMGFGVTEMVATIVWPLFIYLAVRSYATVGIIISVSLMIIVLLDFVVGYFTDHGKIHTLLKYGSLTSAVVHITRILASSLYAVTGINIASDITHTLFRVPWTREFYRNAGADRGTYIAAMELAVCLGRSLFWALLLIVARSASLSTFMLCAFIIGSLGSLLVPLIVSQKRRVSI